MPASEPSSDHLRDCERLAVAVQEAGAIAMKFFRGQLKSWTKGEGDSPVSEADIAANELLHKHLLRDGDGGFGPRCRRRLERQLSRIAHR